jgi:hypothetical protein
MLLGTYILKGTSGSLYGPTFGRGGLSVTFLVNIIQLIGTPTLNISVDTKNEEDTTWSALGTFAGISALGVASADFTGVKEQVRFTYTITATNAWEGVLMQVLAPAWRPY